MKPTNLEKLLMAMAVERQAAGLLETAMIKWPGMNEFFTKTPKEFVARWKGTKANAERRENNLETKNRDRQLSRYKNGS